MPTSFRQHLAGLRILLIFTIALGFGYPLAVTAVGRIFADRADGSLIHNDGNVVGSALIGQRFEGDVWFLPCPSAGDYDTLASGASNLGPESPELLASIAQLRAEIADRESVPESAVPADAVTASASGLDPDISPEYAQLQIPRVAQARGLPISVVEDLVDAHTIGPDLGFLGAAHINVLSLNAALEALDD